MKASIGLIAALTAGTAFAHDHSSPVNDAWLKEQRNAAGQVCCSGDDVLPANDIEWDASGKQYRVKIGNAGDAVVINGVGGGMELVVRRCS
jgi:hypothetical protein